ncbi:uncharacterized protein LOC116258409 isoform X2 [Nymphaea colorata]|uniref:uncharacterized protein LOC116258409 isoform X2 n=1 Tax=Nymphaea colorata TaxID=210225 RepID=UPI00129EBBC6|nr:uncharacterized protein LOC116258409 isoform X2 [Nymphaea colorata]
MPHRVPAYLQYNHSCQTDGAESSDAQQKKSRGLNRGMAVVKLLPGEKFPLRINRLGQPHGSHAKDLSHYLGVLARDLDKAPVIYHTWTELPNSYKDDVWIQVKNKFELPGKRDLPGAFRCYVMDSFRKKWTDWRNVLWNIYYIHDSENARLQACPKEISQDQWKSLMEYFDCEKSKAESFTNANNHAQQMMLQTLGTKSLAYFRTEQSMNGNEDIDVARLDMWIKTHRIVRCSSRKEDVVPIIKLPKDAGCAPIYGLGARVGNIVGSKLSKKLLVLQNEALDQRVRRLEQFMEAQGWCNDDA